MGTFPVAVSNERGERRELRWQDTEGGGAELVAMVSLAKGALRERDSAWRADPSSDKIFLIIFFPYYLDLPL